MLVQRLEDHRQNMMDLMYVQMEEHTQKLNLYSNLFEHLQNSFDLPTEFSKAMLTIDKFPQSDIDEFIRAKATKAPPAAHGARASSAGPPQRSGSLAAPKP